MKSTRHKLLSSWVGLTLAGVFAVAGRGTPVRAGTPGPQGKTCAPAKKPLDCW